MSEVIEKRYIGDGVYAATDDHQIILTAENGIMATDTIYLEPEVMNALVKYHIDHQNEIENIIKQKKEMAQ